MTANRRHSTTGALRTGLLLLPIGILLSASASADDRLEIADASGRPVLVLLLADDDLSIVDGAGALLLRGRLQDSDRVAYTRAGETPLGTVKSDGERFKLEAADGRLLRKVKRDGDRIKIADNEENADAAVIRRRGEDKWELELGKESFGKIKDYPDQGQLKVKDRLGETRYTLAGAPLTPAPLVLLIPGVPPDEARAVLAEIWLRGW